MNMLMNIVGLSISLQEIGETLLMLLIGGVIAVVGIKIAISLAKKAIGFIAIAAVIALCMFGYTIIFPSNSKDTEYVETDETYEDDYEAEEGCEDVENPEEASDGYLEE